MQHQPSETYQLQHQPSPLPIEPSSQLQSQQQISHPQIPPKSNLQGISPLTSQCLQGVPSETYFLENKPTNEAFYQVILFQNCDDDLKKVKGLVAESFNSAVLDSAAAKTVCGKKWFQVFNESLPESHVISTQPCHAGYKFGDSELVIAKECAVIPATLGAKSIYLRTLLIRIYPSCSLGQP